MCYEDARPLLFAEDAIDILQQCLLRVSVERGSLKIS